MSDIVLLHIYAQAQWHSPSCIIGNRAGLERLREAVTNALDGGMGETPEVDGVFASDGEGYEVLVMREDGPWSNYPDTELTVWDRLVMPYREDEARDLPRDTDIQPAQLWMHRQQEAGNV